MSEWHPEMPDEYKNQIVTGDARELAKRMPDESVDLIFTDPPYHSEFLPLYGEIARMGGRVLKEGGLLVAYCGVGWMDQIFTMLGAELDYYWTICNYMPSSNMVFNAKNAGNKWRPILVFSRGKRRTRFFQDGTRGKRDKRYHVWGQAADVPLKYIPSFTEMGGVVFDPCVGGGTTAAACKQLHRNYIAFEIDPETAEKARERVLNTQPPLFVPEPEQQEMSLD